MQKLLFLFLILLASSISYSQTDQKNKSQDLIPWSAPNWQTYQALGYNPETFKVPQGLQKSVDFWIKIYSKYTTHQGVFHIAGDTDQILEAIDLTAVYKNPQWSAVRRELEAERLIKRQKKFIAAKNKIDIKKIRLQMGLKDRMQEAIKLSGYYLPMMEKVFEEEKIPKELTRIVFVESSFNIFAQSKVGASGLWQIMPIVSKKFKYMSEAQDLRNHPLYATKLAARILKENYIILKSWPLAVTAYNHGVGSLSRLVKKYKSNDIGYLIDNVSSSKSFGFASRNFYATYLAALYVESHANLYFPEPIFRHKELEMRILKLTQKTDFTNLLAQFDDDLKKFKFYNPHIKSHYLKKGKKIPAGVVANLPKNDKVKIAHVIDENFEF